MYSVYVSLSWSLSGLSVLSLKPLSLSESISLWSLMYLLNLTFCLCLSVFFLYGVVSLLSLKPPTLINYNFKLYLGMVNARIMFQYKRFPSSDALATLPYRSGWAEGIYGMELIKSLNVFLILLFNIRLQSLPDCSRCPGKKIPSYATPYNDNVDI